MATLSTNTLGFYFDSSYRHYGQVWFYSNGSPSSQLVYLFKDSSDKYHVGIYNGNSATNISSCPSSSNIVYVSNSSDFNIAKDFFTNNGVKTSDWSYNMNSVSVYFDAELTSTYGLYNVDISNAHLIDRDSLASMCSSVVANNTYYKLQPYYTFEIEESSSTTDLTIPILMIPATLIVLSCFTLIYRMFINRKLRA